MVWLFFSSPHQMCFLNRLRESRWSSIKRWVVSSRWLFHPHSFTVSQFVACKDSKAVNLLHLKMSKHLFICHECVCFQVSHALHLSAVSPSYYRFHVEHLQSDDYSKDKVEPESLHAPASLTPDIAYPSFSTFLTFQSIYEPWCSKHHEEKVSPMEHFYLSHLYCLNRFTWLRGAAQTFLFPVLSPRTTNSKLNITEFIKLKLKEVWQKK